MAAEKYFKQVKGFSIFFCGDYVRMAGDKFIMNYKHYYS